MADTEGVLSRLTRRQKAGWLALAGLVAFFVAVNVLIAMDQGASGDGGSDSPEVRRQGAILACQDMVRDQLKAPASAKFSASATGAGPWDVTGTVDAENSYGATLRSDWTCTVRLDDDMFRGNAVLQQ